MYLSTYYMLDTILGAGDIAINKRQNPPKHSGLITFLWLQSREALLRADRQTKEIMLEGGK